MQAANSSTYLLPRSNPASSAVAFIESLGREARAHQAVNHPYLHALAEGELPDLRWALADFARHYAGFTRHFRRYLGVVCLRLERPDHQEALLGKLDEELGNYDEAQLEALARAGIEREWVEGIPHPLLFRRFCGAVGAEPSLPGDEAPAVVCWREMFMHLLSDASPAAAIGAIGLGTESIVEPVHTSLAAAIRRVPELTPRETVFFPLRIAVDGEHAATLFEIATDFAGNMELRAELRWGMLAALNLRHYFWNWLHARALAPRSAE